ncbi:methyltransferase [Athelia psychrophila]|uniref:tRNA N(3)-methylcytidine methyltransferase n=1 Tax=Athelia psychrophila TaxID=1759441 RepID=A0A165XAC1_9AGAM|nr:methyltransferase [Fibularhizoctonia sp. CBS 109695]
MSEDQGSSTAATASRTASSVHDINAEKPPFGARFLTDDADVWSQNAWDHVPPPDDQGEIIAASLAKQRVAPVPDDDKPKYNDRPSRHWDNFYKTNTSNFFKNRKWLQIEFPELVQATEPEAGPMTIAEIGCGAGNAVFPLLESNQNKQLSLRAFDYSAQAVKLVQSNPLYINPPVGTINSAVWDLTSMDALPPGVEPSSVDIVILVFVMSALHPDEWGCALANINTILKPGGRVLFRDYGRHDLTQLRFKAGRLLDDNFYIRGDKTRVYFFELDELALLFTGSIVPSAQEIFETTKVTEDADVDADANPASSPTTLVATTSTSEATPPENLNIGDLNIGISDVPHLLPSPSSIHPNLSAPLTDCPPHPLFAIEKLGVDRRLIVNRKRQLKMYRVWMQGKFVKLA